jgi:hypothetical protein
MVRGDHIRCRHNLGFRCWGDYQIVVKWAVIRFLQDDVSVSMLNRLQFLVASSRGGCQCPVYVPSMGCAEDSDADHRGRIGSGSVGRRAQALGLREAAVRHYVCGRADDRRFPSAVPRLNRGRRGAGGSSDVMAVVPGGRRVHCALFEEGRDLRHGAGLSSASWRANDGPNRTSGSHEICFVILEIMTVEQATGSPQPDHQQHFPTRTTPLHTASDWHGTPE